MIRRARDVDDLSAQVLKLCVQQSRDAGQTWQEIGDLLGVTRQAAFQRFGKPIDPRTGEPMDKTVTMADAAVVIVGLIAGWEYFCLTNLAQAERVRFLPRWAWALACLMQNPLGGILYLLIGRVWRRRADR